MTEKGQLLLTVRSDDVAGGYSNYRKAISDEILSRAQLERTKDLYEHGALALNDVQIAQDVEDKAKVVFRFLLEFGLWDHRRRLVAGQYAARKPDQQTQSKVKNAKQVAAKTK